MEEDIKLLKKITNCFITKEMAQAIENLINKCKEQERDIRDTHILIAKYSQKNEEQEKIIELMAKDIAENKLDEDICRQVKDPKKEECYAYMHDENACSDCVMEYYKKKAREENEKR